jgi:primosomal protein N' (replication factor Y)
MTIFVEISVNVPHVSGVFHYHLPDHLEGKVDRGHLVTVPFGKQTVQGVVLQTVDDPSVPQTRPVDSLLDPKPVVTATQIELAHYLADYTLTSLSTCLTLMLPPGLSQMADTLYQLTPAGEQRDQSESDHGGDELSRAQWRLLTLLQERGPLRGRQIAHALPRKRWKATARALERRGLLVSEPILQSPDVSPKTVRTARLACSPEKAEAQLDQLGRQGFEAIKRRQAMVRHLIDRPDSAVTVSQLYQVSEGNANDIRVLEEKGIITVGERQVWRDPLDELDFVLAEAPPLTEAQQDVWEQVQAGIQRASSGTYVPPYLLYGVTGSGKTEIYLRAVEAVLQQGRSVVVLVPEIALTPQTIERFVSRFPDQVGLIHSKLSRGERYDTWRRARSGEISVVVGPRSALFTPFEDIGLIVLDECHDDSYYQAEPAPSYHARTTAVAYAHQLGAVCLMGSATPDVISTYRAAKGEWTSLSLPDRILAHKKAVQAQMKRIQLDAKSHYRPLEKDAQTADLPPVEIVDMRAELQAGNRSIFSRTLQESLEDVFTHGQQAILFLNRRGTATYVFCRDCGYSLECPRCDIPLTYHLHGERRGQLICHRCGYKRLMPKKCPDCGGTRIKHYGTGTERVETEIHNLFPQVRTLRWDWETTRKKGSHEQILRQFSRHQADVLIGTQMLAKGLDLPLVTLVGAVLADVGLNLPDYRADERVFQVLTQVAGRAGRSPLGGKVILQTFKPDHYVVQTAAEHDYRDFYRQAIHHRRNLGYPPFARLVRLELRGQDSEQVENAADNLAETIQGWIDGSNAPHTEMIGPVPCFFARVGGIYRWQIVLRGPDPAKLLKPEMLKSCRIEIDPPSLL